MQNDQEIVGTRGSDSDSTERVTPFRYLARRRFSMVLGVGIAVLLGIAFTARGLFMAEELIWDTRRVTALISLWTIVAVLIGIVVFFGLRIVHALQPIFVSDEFIQGALREKKFRLLPRKKTGRLYWQEIESVETIQSTDIEAFEMKDRRGIRVVAGQKTLVIYEDIRDYKKLKGIILQRAARTGE